MDLPAQLGADRPARARDEHPSVGEIPGDRLDVGVNLVPAKQVGEFDIAQVTERDARLQHLPQRRHDLDTDFGSTRPDR